MRARNKILVLVLVLLLSQTTSGIVKKIVSPLTEMLCDLYDLFVYIASGVAAVVMGIAGLKWVGSENDPAARKQAKETIVHAIIGLILVIVARQLVAILVGTTPCQ
jgi:hypothetical protein